MGNTEVQGITFVAQESQQIRVALIALPEFCCVTYSGSVVGWALLDPRCPPKLLCHCPPQPNRGEEIQQKAHGSG